MKTVLPIFMRSANSFEGEESDEKVVLLIRRHPFFVLVRLFFLIILALAPLVFYEFFSGVLQAHNLLDVFFFLCSAWCLFIWSGIFYFLTMYTLDVWIVTDHRIIDSTQKGFFNRTVSELHISRIQDISVETKGVIQTFIKFGDLQVQTAGAEEKFMFSQIPHPDRVKDKIMELVSTHSPAHV
jgi:uncharacterized membrane protein YdbT with pleckstrin-like domain